MAISQQIHRHTEEQSCESNRDLGWCFWDETGDCYGPFSTLHEVMQVFESYCHWLETGE